MLSKVFSKGDKLSIVVYEGQNENQATATKDYISKLINEKYIIGRDVDFELIFGKVDFVCATDMNFEGGWNYIVIAEVVIQ